MSIWKTNSHSYTLCILIFSSELSLIWYVGEHLTCHLTQPISVNKLSPFLNLLVIQTHWDSTPNMWLALITAALSLTVTNKVFSWNQKHGGRKGDEEEEWATAAVVMVRTFNFDQPEAWPGAFGGHLLDRGTRCVGKRANNTNTFTHIDFVPRIKYKESIYIIFVTLCIQYILFVHLLEWNVCLVTECEQLSTWLFVYRWLCTFVCVCTSTVVCTHECACENVCHWTSSWLQSYDSQTYSSTVMDFSLRAAVGFHESVCSSHPFFLLLLSSCSPLLLGN